jgi:hypothetical protein
MPNSLDVAKQRKLLEELQRDGRSTRDAEIRLRDMLDVIASVHRSGVLGIQQMTQASREASQASRKD